MQSAQRSKLDWKHYFGALSGQLRLKLGRNLAQR
jgi:hypothetical protein